MKYDKFKSKFNIFEESNSDLIEVYEGLYPGDVTNSLYEMYVEYTNLSKKRKDIDIQNFLRLAFEYAIKNQSTILGSLKDLTNELMRCEFPSALQRYFHEVNNVYNKNNNNYDIPFCPENRDKILEMNLKTVISVAKGYRGLGLSFEELISAGNEGLVIAFDKYNPARAKLKDNMVEAIKNLDDNCTKQDIIDHMMNFMSYGDIKRKFIDVFAADENGQVIVWKDFNKKDVLSWINKNVRNATFNSVAFMWIRAYILIEIDNNSRIVKKPKSEIYNDRQKYGAYKKEMTLDIDAPVGSDGKTCVGDLLCLDDASSRDNASEAYDAYKKGLDLLLTGVKARDRSVFLKKFGVGLPRPMLPREIAEQENLSIARISQIFQAVIDKVQENQAKYNINIEELLDAASRIN